MKKIYNKIVLVTIEGKTENFFDTSIYNDFHYIDETEAEPHTVTYPKVKLRVQKQIIHFGATAPI